MASGRYESQPSVLALQLERLKRQVIEKEGLTEVAENKVKQMIEDVEKLRAELEKRKQCEQEAMEDAKEARSIVAPLERRLESALSDLALWKEKNKELEEVRDGLVARVEELEKDVASWKAKLHAEETAMKHVQALLAREKEERKADNEAAKARELQLNDRVRSDGYAQAPFSLLLSFRRSKWRRRSWRSCRRRRFKIQR